LICLATIDDEKSTLFSIGLTKQQLGAGNELVSFNALSSVGLLLPSSSATK
jgi:hypothetical protein